MTEKVDEKVVPFDTMSIDKEMVIKAPPAQVFNALTGGAGLWWGSPYLDKVDEASDMIFEPKLGGHLYERWGKTTQGDGAIHGTVVALQKPNLIRLEGPFGNGDRVVQNVVSFELNENAAGTRVKFSHRAAGEIDEVLKLRYSTGWSDLLNRLKEFAEGHQAHGVRHDPLFEH